MFVQRNLTDTVPTRLGNMHFVKQGSGFPLVMLHPNGSSTWAWHTVIDSLSRYYTCYAFDMPGHGESDKPTRDFINMPDYAQGLDDACQILNIHRGHYVGNSVGASLAIEMAASFPARLDKLVLVGCPGWDPFKASQRLKDSAGESDENGLPKPRTLTELKQRSTFVDPRPEWLEASNRAHAQAGVWVGKIRHTLAHYDIMARLPLVNARATLVMYGEHDRRRGVGDLLLNNIRNASTAILPGVGHVPQIEDPEGFVDALVSFLQPES